MNKKEVCSNETKLKEEIKTIIARIQSSLEVYRKELYTPTPEKIKVEILNNLISAQKVLSMYELLIDCNNSTFNVAKKEIKFKFMSNQISHATRLTRKYYNNDVAKEVDKILGSFIKKIEYIKEHEGDFKYLPEVKYIRDLGKTIILDYVKEEVEIPDEAYNLIEFYEESDDEWGYEALKVYELIGIKEVLVELEATIDTRVQQYGAIEKNILLDFIESEVNFDKILARINA